MRLLGRVEVAMTRSVALLSNSIALLLVLSVVSNARAQITTSAVEIFSQAILANPKVAKALDDIKADDARTFAEQKRIAEIPAPPFKEKARADYFLKRFQDVGFKDASIDAEGNVIALRAGSAGKPKLVISAHLDTVFPDGTDVTVKEKDGVVRAPGIGDDARGLAVLLSVLQALNANEIKTVGDVMFVGTVGEEELGNLRGVKSLRTSTVLSRWMDFRLPGLSIKPPAAIATRWSSKPPAVTVSRSSACRARSMPWGGRSRRSQTCKRHPIPKRPSPLERYAVAPP